MTAADTATELARIDAELITTRDRYERALDQTDLDLADTLYQQIDELLEQRRQVTHGQ